MLIYASRQSCCCSWSSTSSNEESHSCHVRSGGRRSQCSRQQHHAFPSISRTGFGRLQTRVSCQSAKSRTGSPEQQTQGNGRSWQEMPEDARRCQEKPRAAKSQQPTSSSRSGRPCQPTKPDPASPSSQHGHNTAWPATSARPTPNQRPATGLGTRRLGNRHLGAVTRSRRVTSRP